MRSGLKSTLKSTMSTAATRVRLPVWQTTWVFVPGLYSNFHVESFPLTGAIHFLSCQRYKLCMRASERAANSRATRHTVFVSSYWEQDDRRRRLEHEVRAEWSLYFIGFRVPSHIRLVKRAHDLLLSLVGYAENPTTTLHNDSTPAGGGLLASHPRCRPESFCDILPTHVTTIARWHG